MELFREKFEKNLNFVNFSNMSKVFRYFERNPCMQIAAIASIILIMITVITFGIIFTVNPNSDYAEVENTLDKEIRPNEEINPEIQEKLDSIEKINLENEYSPQPREWKTSGPFQIDRDEYAIGEKIFIRIGGLQIGEKGQIAVMRPLNTTHYTVYMTIPFDEEKKSAFNYYLEPQISKTRNICDIDDLTGKWTLVFRGTDYPNLDFTISENVLPGTNIETVC